MSALEQEPSGWDDLARQHDASLDEDLRETPVNIPPAPTEDPNEILRQHAEDREKAEAKLAVFVVAGMVTAGVVRGVIQHRKRGN